MSFIIVWRNSGREPFIEKDSRSEKKQFNSFSEAKEYADKTLKSFKTDNQWSFDYAIYQEVNS